MNKTRTPRPDSASSAPTINGFPTSVSDLGLNYTQTQGGAKFPGGAEFGIDGMNATI
jgi:hypothetical protein